jgi:hypothetical protein
MCLRHLEPQARVHVLLQGRPLQLVIQTCKLDFYSGKNSATVFICKIITCVGI